MGFNSSTFALLRQQALAPQSLPQTLPQSPAPVSLPVDVPESTPFQQASEAQALAADALSGAQALGGAWSDFLGAPAVPVAEAAPAAPAPSLFETGLSAEQNQAIEAASLNARIAQAGGQEAYDRSQAELAAQKAADPQGFADRLAALEGAMSNLSSQSQFGGLNGPKDMQTALDFSKSITADQFTALSVGLANLAARLSQPSSRVSLDPATLL